MPPSEPVGCGASALLVGGSCLARAVLTGLDKAHPKVAPSAARVGSATPRKWHGGERRRCDLRARLWLRRGADAMPLPALEGVRDDQGFTAGRQLAHCAEVGYLRARLQLVYAHFVKHALTQWGNWLGRRVHGRCSVQERGQLPRSSTSQNLRRNEIPLPSKAPSAKAV